MKRLLSVVGFTSLLTLLRIFSGFVISKFIAIYTGPTGLVMLGQLQGLVSVLNGIVNSPAGSGVVRYTAENIHDGFDECSPWWRASLQYIVIIIAIVIPIGLLFSNQLSLLLFNKKEYYWIIILVCCCLPLSAISTLITSIINGTQKYKLYITLGMVSTTISFLFMVTFIYLYNIEGALIVAAMNSGIIGLIMIISSLNQPWIKFRYWFGKVEKGKRENIQGYIGMALATALTVPISLIIIRKILIYHLGWDLTGQWQAVWKISEVYLSVVTISLGTYFLPKLSSLHSMDEIKNEINKSAVVILPVVILLSVIIYLFRSEIIGLLFTSDFENATKLFAIQLIGNVIKVTAWLYAYPMISKGKVKLFIILEILASTVFVIFSYFFVVNLGVDGVTISYVLTYIFYFSTTYYCLYVKKV